MIFLSHHVLRPAALMRRLAAERAGGRVGDQAQTLRRRDRTKSPGRLVERREAQPLSPKGARVPRQASQTCLDRRAERTLARSVGGASHAPGASRRSIAPRLEGKGKRESGVTRAAKKQRTGPAER